MTHLRITQAGLVSLAVTIVGQLVAFVPSFASREQILISAASTTISAAFLIANAVHALVSKPPATVTVVSPPSPVTGA